MITDIISGDFETRSAVDIKLGVELYSKDPECEVITFSYRLPGETRISRWHRGYDLSQAPTQQMMWDLGRLEAHIRAGGLFRGWNVMFEYHIWNNVCVPKYGWCPLPLEQLIDTMAQAAAMNIPQALGKAAAVLGTKDQKEKRGKYLIGRLCKKHKATNTLPARFIVDPVLFEEFCDYCDMDVIVEESIARKLRPLIPFEQTIWLLTQRVNLRGVPIAVDKIRGIITVIEAEKERLNRELRVITGRRVLKATDRAGLLRWCNERATDIDFVKEKDEDPEEYSAGDDDIEEDEPLLVNMKGKTVDALLERTDLPADVRRALEIRRAVCQTSTAKFSKMLKIMAVDGTVKNMFVYHGAGPGRWASRGGLNVQNFARPTIPKSEIPIALEILGRGDHATAAMFFGEDVMSAAVSCLRSVLEAPDGYEFVDADYSSVENRMGVWLADQHDKVAMFASGLDEYRVFASTALYNCEYDAVTGDMRQMSKSAVLGCLFGQGAKGLVEYAKGYGVHLTLERATEIVKLYRSDYDRVKALWYICGDASVEAVRRPGQWIEAGSKLKLMAHKNFLWMRLPSGRLISWASPVIESRLAPWKDKKCIGHDKDNLPVYVEIDVWKDVVTVESIETKTRQWCRHVLIGSSIFQSAVQGSARDLLACGLVNVEAAGYPVCLTAHDELMACVPAGFGSVDRFGALMMDLPPWADGLPMAFEGYRARNFKK